MKFYFTVYKITETSDLIFTTRASWRSFDRTKTDNSTNTDSNLAVYDNSRARIVLRKSNGWIEDYRRSKVLSSRRNDVRRNPLIMVNVITDSNETRKHMNDRL